MKSGTDTCIAPGHRNGNPKHLNEASPRRPHATRSSGRLTLRKHAMLLYMRTCVSRGRPLTSQAAHDRGMPSSGGRADRTQLARTSSGGGSNGPHVGEHEPELEGESVSEGLAVSDEASGAYRPTMTCGKREAGRGAAPTLASRGGVA